MSNILTIGYIGEGTTDKRFLGNIIRRTFEDLAFDCKGQIDVYDPEYIEVEKQKFVEQSVQAAKKARWLNILCIHTDADSDTDDNAFNNKIIPTMRAIIEFDESDLCKNIVAIVPIQMTEAWMLSDMNILIDEIGNGKTPQELQLPTRQKQIESLNDPKKVLENAISIAYQDSPKRKKISISDLYSPLSMKLDLNCLEQLQSYKKFKLAARNALELLNYI